MPGSIANAATMMIALEVDDRGAVKIRRVGEISEKAAKKGDASFRKMDRSLTDFNARAGKTFGTVQRLAGSLGVGGLAGGMGLAAAVGLVTKAFNDGRQSAMQWERRLLRTGALVRATGNAAGISAGELADFAKRLDLATLGDRDQILSAINVLQTFKSVSGEVFEDSIMRAMDLAEVLESDVKSQVLQLGKALEDPVTGLTALKRAGVSFTEAEKETIKTLVETNRKLEAQKMILAALEGQVGGAAEGAAGGMAGALDTLTFRYREFTEALQNSERTIWIVEKLADALHALTEMRLADRIALATEDDWDAPYVNEAFTAEARAKRREDILRERTIAISKSYGGEDFWLMQHRNSTQADVRARAEAEAQSEAARQKELERQKKLPSAIDAELDTALDGGWDSVLARQDQYRDAYQERLEMLADFNDAYEKTTMDQYAFERLQVERQAEAWAKAGADKVRLAEWQAAEIARINEDEADSFKKTADRMEEIFDTTGASMKSAFGDFFDAASQDFMDFGDLASNILNDISRKMIDLTLDDLVGGKTDAGGYTGLMGMIQTLFNAHGNVFHNGSPVMFAKGGILTQPTMFPMVNGGIGIAGEAGYEGLFPVKKMPDGDLGVKAEVNSASPRIEINITNQSGTEIEQGPVMMQQSADKVIANMVIKRKMTSRSFRSAIRS